jgi:Conserved region in glutamate synthase
MVNVAREAMFAIGCIQSQRCHTDKCPTGIATQNPWLGRGVDPPSKSERLANYLRTFRRDLVRVSEAVGVVHPGLVSSEDIDVMDRTTSSASLAQTYGYEPDWGLPSAVDRAAIAALMRPRVDAAHA